MQFQLNSKNRAKINYYKGIKCYLEVRGKEKAWFLDFSLSFAIFLACIIGKPLMHQVNGTELCLDILIFAK